MRMLLLASALLAATPALSQDHSAHAPPVSKADGPDHEAMDHDAMDHEGMDHSAHAMPADPGSAGEAPPPRALAGPRHAADAIYGRAAMEPAREALAQENGGFRSGTIIVERLEAHLGDGADGYLWDVQGWYGGDLNRVWVKSEGKGIFGGGIDDAEVQALFSHAIGPWFDVQAGIRYDLEPASTAHAVIGVQGLAPYMFEVDAAAFLSEHGDLTASMEAEYDYRITQRLILQPRAELELSAQDIPGRDIGAGLTAMEAGLRLRYELRREFAPYVGVAYQAALGETAERMRAREGDADGWRMLAGLRAWF
jgi:copper resistance protein B